MYHDTIHIIFKSKTGGHNIHFEYDFLISKSPYSNHSTNSISYQEILNKFKKIGFNIDFLNFPDIKDMNQMVHCKYNYLVKSGDYNVFFKAYEKILKRQGFDIIFEYGTMINGKFFPNNMNFYSSISFICASINDSRCFSHVIKGFNFYKTYEKYQIVDKTGKILHNEFTNYTIDFKHNFFKNQKVKVYLRKYKLRELKSKLN